MIDPNPYIMAAGVAGFLFGALVALIGREKEERLMANTIEMERERANAYEKMIDDLHANYLILGRGEHGRFVKKK